jgi:Ca2+-binding RTX toxin-like protein
MTTPYNGIQPGTNSYNPGNGFRIVSGFPTRNDGVKPHAGVDWAAPQGTSISAAADGVVHFVQTGSPNPTAGYWVVLKHTLDNGDFFYTSYLHMQAASPLRPGDVVTAGQVVGFVGSTGRSEAPHLHFEIVPSGQNPLAKGHTTVDPVAFSGWRNLGHMIGTDNAGNPITAQSTGSVASGYSQTIITTKTPAGAVLGSSVSTVLAEDDGAGNTIGTKTVFSTYGTAAGGSNSQVVTWSNLDGSTARRVTTQNDGVVILEQNGITVTTQNGIKTATIDGITASATVNLDGSITVATSTGHVNISLSSDPRGGGTISAGGQPFQFNGTDNVYAQEGGIAIYSPPGSYGNADALKATERLINATGSGLEYIYEPVVPYTDPMGGIYGPISLNGSEGNAPEVDYTLTETRAIGNGSTGPTTNTVTLSINTTGTATNQGATDPTTAPNANGAVATGSDWSLLLAENTANVDTSYYGGVVSDAGSGGYRPGNNNASGTGAQTANVSDSAAALLSALADITAGGGAAPTYVAPEVSYAAANLTNLGYNTPLIPADPLVLDLNGDGIKLQSYAASKAYFDIDNDGAGVNGQATKEHTGWVAANTTNPATSGQAFNTDGIVVHDLNNDGQINGIKETLSEFYNGNQGIGQTAGQKTYADGFAALKSLDRNNDNQFNKLDAAWSSLRVWVDDDANGQSFKDTNGNGIKDAGEATELKTFAELGITSINLAKTAQSGLVNNGNEVLSSSTFVQNGLTQAAQAVRFIANPNGSSYAQSTTAGVAGATLTTQGNAGTADVKSYVSGNTLTTVNETLNATSLNVSNIYAGAGNDVLTGDANANWLAGGAGSDTFNAGAGDDVLLIDAADQQQNINAGAGNDVVQVVGSAGVTFNMAQAQAEVFVGGTGDDVIIGGGRSTVFIRGGAGDDLIIGGAANDVLSGEDGADTIDGGAGNDLIRGHRGQDQLLGGAGDDVIDGGLDDDTLSGGTGNDVLIGGRGDDAINGGDGIDVAQYSGSYADYRITKIRDAASGGTTFRVVDTRTGQDGADTLTNIEKLSFSDVSRVDLTLGSPLPVKDILAVNSTGQALSRTAAHLLSKQQLLANDRDWDSDVSQLTITKVMEFKGGIATLTQSCDVLFTPDASYTGVMGFKYTVQDAQRNYTQVTSPAGQTVAMKAAVYLQTSDIPNDPLAVEQWYLADTNVFAAWGTEAEQAAGQGYSGKGIKIGQFEPGGPFSTGPELFDYRHPDLAPNADKAWLNTLDSQGNNITPQTFSNHATMVAGVMVAARNCEGVVGAAYNASLAGHYIQGEGLEVSQLNAEITAALARFKNYDVGASQKINHYKKHSCLRSYLLGYRAKRLSKQARNCPKRALYRQNSRYAIKSGAHTSIKCALSQIDMGASSYELASEQQRVIYATR